MRYLLLLLPLFLHCRPEAPDTVPLPTRICVTTQHHGQPIREATVFIKYNVDTFPGYQQPDAYFDASFTVGSDARGCLQSVPEGHHWLIARGKDRLYVEPPYDVWGNLPVRISLKDRPVVDTVVYVSEKH